MKNIELLESNHPITNGSYSAFQFRLSLDFFTVVPVDDPVTSFVEIMKGINTSKYLDCFYKGNKGYAPQYDVAGCIVCVYEWRKWVKKNGRAVQV